MSSPDIDIAVAPATAAQLSQAAELAGKLGLPVSDPKNHSFRLLLVYTDERLELRQTGPNSPGPVYVDFLAGKADYRHRYGSSKDEGLIQAVASKRNRLPTVLDATAGLGRDAFVLATHGCRVTICEEQPVIAALLDDGINRAAADPNIGKIVRDNLRLITGDSLEVMAALPEEERPEVVYLDPMFPQKGKKALVKKESQALRLIAGEDLNSSALLQQALKTARSRVVVKRPAFAPPLDDQKPALVSRTKNNRFDIYLIAPSKK